jgi:hypothetical protein
MIAAFTDSPGSGMISRGPEGSDAFCSSRETRRSSCLIILFAFQSNDTFLQFGKVFGKVYGITLHCQHSAERLTFFRG